MFLQRMQFSFKMVKLILNRSESRGSVAWQMSGPLCLAKYSAHTSDGQSALRKNRGIPVVIDSPKSKVTSPLARWPLH